MSVRLTAALIAGLLCGAWGQRYAGRIKAEAQQFRRWIAILERLQLTLEHGTLPLPDALEEAADMQEAPDKLLRSLAGKLRSDPRCALSDCYVELDEQTLADSILRPLMTQLDRGCIENRVLSVRQTLVRMRQAADSAAIRAQRDAPMWSRLGWAGGACMTILLL